MLLNYPNPVLCCRNKTLKEHIADICSPQLLCIFRKIMYPPYIVSLTVSLSQLHLISAAFTIFLPRKHKVGHNLEHDLTHDAPSRFLDFTALALGESNRLHLFLDEILLKLTYEKWFFGCYHRMCSFPPRAGVCSVTSSPWASGAPGCSTDRRQNAGHNKTCHPGGRCPRQRHSGGFYPAVIRYGRMDIHHGAVQPLT